MRTLPDYLRKGMRMILVGANPGDRSARVGHYYAGRGNQFWPIMYESGVIPEPLSYEDDRRILEFGIGMTDLVKRPTRAKTRGLETSRRGLQWQNGVREIHWPPLQAGPAKGKALWRAGFRAAFHQRPERRDRTRR